MSAGTDPRARRAALSTLLSRAALLMQSVQPQWQVTMRAPHDLDALQPQGDYLVRFDWPGVLSVHVKCSGRLVVRSKSGQPLEVDDGGAA